ncbi:gas vesicle protein GvpO, halophile-type [Halegenticoccus tardaugens]|uniref:gas vesicle protein GvpO, halophile-type n=1 Tax=Halegenticoccus tardaugens TaxID=2071624 RepID=UPI00100B48F8|nr:gas vesicle protein GvpO [Halegenticoccus tardaugens]
MSEADAAADGDDRCRALTADGTRCSRPARDGEFCYQHDESDRTIDERDGETDASEVDETEASEGDDADDDEGDGSDGGSTESERKDDDGKEGEAEGSDDQETESMDEETDDGDESSDGGADLMGVRDTVLDLAADVIGRDLDGITEVTRDDDGWRAVVEVIERRSVPDTQDILGRYEIELDGGGEIRGYRRLDRYRRADTVPDEY